MSVRKPGERPTDPTPDDMRKARHAIHYVARAIRAEWFRDELEEAIRIIVRDELARGPDGP